MTQGLRDYVAWHADYDDPESPLSWRLRVVQEAIAVALDASTGPVRIISACAGDGRDVLGVLSRRTDAGRVRATLLELHPVIAERARAAADTAGLGAHVEVRAVDAGHSDAYADLAPAEIVLLVGILGNINPDDIERLIASSAQLCTVGATLIWTSGRGAELTDRNDAVRSSFRAAGFTELGYSTLERGGKPAVGVVRYDGPPAGLVPGRRWFTFER